jgi:hypothetical protein
MCKINMYIAGVACLFLVTSLWPHFLRNQFHLAIFYADNTLPFLSLFLFSLKQTLIVNPLFFDND